MGNARSVGSILTFFGGALIFGGVALMMVAILQRQKAVGNTQVAPAVPKPKLGDRPVKKAVGASPTPKSPVRRQTTQPRVLHQAEPEYSPEAKQARYGGTVHVSVKVGVDGRVHDVQILDSPGLGLDEKITEALEKWRFAPAVKDGVPVDEKATISLTFRLR